MKIKDIIQKLASESSINKRITILKENKDNEVFKKILFYAYNPQYNFYLNKLDDFTNQGIMEIDSFQDIETLLKDLSNRIVTGNAARELTNKILSQYDLESQEIFKTILKRDLRCNVGISLINKAISKNFIPEFKIQLANKYDENKKYKVDYFYATPKLDGVRAFWTASMPNILWSRGGKEFVCMEHILEDINKIVSINPDITFIDGELFTKQDSFSDIQGTVTSSVNYNKDDKKRIKYNVFAIGSETFNNTDDMQIEIEKLVLNNFETIEFVTAQKVNNNKQDIINLAKEFVDNGYEGIMLRNPDNYYDFKRSNNLLKFKFFKEDDLKVVGMIEGTGKYKGMLGALICEGAVDEKYITTEVGTGFSDNDRMNIWNNKEVFINSIAEIKYQEISCDSNNNYSLRFPVFLKFKGDR